MKDKIVVVTGSTSGIGLGIASKFAKNGAKLVINGFASDSEVKKLSKELYRDWETDRKSTRLNSSHSAKSRMPSSA